MVRLPTVCLLLISEEQTLRHRVCSCSSSNDGSFVLVQHVTSGWTFHARDSQDNFAEIRPIYYRVLPYLTKPVDEMAQLEISKVAVERKEKVGPIGPTPPEPLILSARAG